MADRKQTSRKVFMRKIQILHLNFYPPTTSFRALQTNFIKFVSAAFLHVWIRCS